MNEFLHRNEPVISAVSATDRVSARAVQPASQTSRAEVSAGSTKGQAAVPDAVETAMPSGGPSPDETARAFANYARIQTQIANVVADLSPPAPQSPAALAQANDSLLSLLPKPSVVLPLPPADEDMVAFVAQVAQSIARQAAQTRAAHANVSAPSVDAATA